MAITRRPVEEVTAPPSAYIKAPAGARLYANDFDSLLEFLRQGDREVTIRAGKSAWIEHSVDLRELKSSERAELHLTVTDPPVEIRLSSDSRVLTRYISNSEAKRLVNQTIDLLASWKTMTSRFVVWPFAIVWGFVLIVWLAIGIPVAIVEGPSHAVGLAWFALLGLLWLVNVLTMGHRVVVSARDRHDAAERRVKALGSIAIAVAGGVAGSLATWFLALGHGK